MKTFNHHSNTRERSMAPQPLTSREKRRAEQRKKAKAMRRRLRLAKLAANPSITTYHFSH